MQLEVKPTHADLVVACFVTCRRSRCELERSSRSIDNCRARREARLSAFCATAEAHL
jgi:hypothetical protein